MNEEEKKAIEIVKEFNKNNRFRDCRQVNNAINTLLSLVEEQQHKIEKLINANDNLKKTKRIKNMEYVNQNYVSKDKIKEKIKEYEGLKEIDKTAYEEQIKPLKELIDELVDYAIKAKKNDDKSVMYEGNRGKEIINQNILFEKVDETNG